MGCTGHYSGAKLIDDRSKSNRSKSRSGAENKPGQLRYARTPITKYTTIEAARRCRRTSASSSLHSTLRGLLINIDHVATLRNARREAFPDPVHAAAICEAAGADGIVFHLREDRRHITDRDVVLLKETVKGKLDFELSMDPEMIAICCDTAPGLATLVPERREEITTEGGLDVIRSRDRLAEVIPALYDAGVEEVALFVDPVIDQVDAAHESGANTIELHTGDYANATTRAEQLRLLEKLRDAADHASSIGLKVHAGHGLDYNNFPLFAKQVSAVEEVSIGFAVIARAVLVGMESAVRDMAAVVKKSYAE